MSHVYQTWQEQAYRKLKGLIFVYPYGTLNYWRALADAEIEID